MEAIAALKKHAIPEKARFFPYFFKTGPGEYGEHDKFIGVTVPNVRKVAKQFRDLSLSEVEELLANEVHEIRQLGLFILVDKFHLARKDDKMQKQIVDFYLGHLEAANNWDLVDLSCYKILGAYVVKHPDQRKILYKLAKSKVMWHQRIAMVSCFALIKSGDYADVVAIAKLLLDHEHDLMHKAVGWMLRELGKHDEQQLKDFLANHYKTMPRTALRYAIERFPPEVRQAYLRGLV